MPLSKKLSESYISVDVILTYSKILNKYKHHLTSMEVRENDILKASKSYSRHKQSLKSKA
jgi:hypothetical protein